MLNLVLEEEVAWFRNRFGRMPVFERAAVAAAALDGAGSSPETGWVASIFWILICPAAEPKVSELPRSEEAFQRRSSSRRDDRVQPRV